MLRKVHKLLSTCMAVTVVAMLYTNVPAQDARETTHRNTINQYCVACHNQILKTAGLTLDALDYGNMGKDAPQWEKVLRKLRNRQMPPAGMPRPDVAVYDSLIAYIETELDRAAEQDPNPGRPDVHRLNRTEYTNVIRDLRSC